MICFHTLFFYYLYKTLRLWYDVFVKILFIIFKRRLDYE
nr:MAG TPA: hypothetical protein [Bacteriophage sp.]